MNFHWKKMKAKCEVTERGTLVNLSTTHASEKLINGKSITLKPQRTKNSEQWGKAWPVTRYNRMSDGEKTKSLSLIVLLARWPDGSPVPKTLRWGNNVRKSFLSSKDGRLPTCCVLRTRREGKTKRPWMAAWWGTREPQGAQRNALRERGMVLGRRWPPLLFQENRYGLIVISDLCTALAKWPELHGSYCKEKVKGVFCWSKSLWITRLGEVTHIYHGLTMGAGPAPEQELAGLLWNALLSAEHNLKPGNTITFVSD